MNVLTPDSLAEFLRGYRFTFGSEDDLQRGVDKVLRDWGALYERERRISGRDRLDFLVAPTRESASSPLSSGIAIECKIQGTETSLLRQVHRYLGHEMLTGLVVVTCRLRHRLPHEISGKPVAVVHLLQGM